MHYKILDQKAKTVAQDYKRCEKQLVAVIAEIDLTKAFYKLGFKSLFSYMTDGLELSPAVANNISTVVRKSYQVPALKEKVVSGEITLCKARRIAPVIDQHNQNRWFEVAQGKTQRQIEREVALASPQHAIPERVSYSGIDNKTKNEALELGLLGATRSGGEKVTIKQKIPRIKLELGMSEKLMLKIRRCQDLESQRKKVSINLESCLDAMAESYLAKHDPLRKAGRQKSRGKIQISKQERQNELEATNSNTINTEAMYEQFHAPTAITKAKSDNASASVSRQISKRKIARTNIPAPIRHSVQLRDQGRCAHIDRNGQRCGTTRFVEFHHIQPVSQGGSNQVENLQLLCSGHHKMLHMK